MNTRTAVAVMVGALIAGTAPLTLLNIHEQKQREIVLEERRELAYLKCQKDITDWIELTTGKTYFIGEEVTELKAKIDKKCGHHKEEK